LSDNIDVKVTEVNTLLSQVAALNAEIYRIEGFGHNANDLRDQRDYLVDQLSRVINVSVVHEERGYTIFMGNIELVNGADANEFNLAMAEASYVEDGTGNLNNGELFGLFYSRDKLVNDYANQLDALVTTLVENVNAVHRQGYTLKHPVEMGGDFFTFVPVDPDDTSPPSFAARFRVSQSITDDVENIAASARTYDDNGVTRVVKGNNENALAISDLRNVKFNFADGGIQKIILNGGTFDEFLRAVIGEMGVQAQEAERQTTNQRILVEQVESRRSSVSGVSLDEEMANMIKFQHAYNAAARAMTVYDEVLDKVINGMGIVGR